MPEERKIHITLNPDKTATIGINKNGYGEGILVDGCYQVEVFRAYKNIFEICESQQELAREKGKEDDIPEEYRPRKPEQVGRALILTFCKDFYLMNEPLGGLVRVPDLTVKKLDDLLGNFELEGKRTGKTYTCYDEHQYSIPLPEGVGVFID